MFFSTMLPKSPIVRVRLDHHPIKRRHSIYDYSGPTSVGAGKFLSCKYFGTGFLEYLYLDGGIHGLF